MTLADNAKKGKILVVDDTPANIGVILTYLRDQGFKMLVAEDGESAIEQVEYIKPDLILLDVMMPGIDGFQTCELLKQNPDTKNIPVIFMSALNETVDKVKGFQVGAVDYITKPFQQEEVLARINTHLRLERLQRELKTTNSNLERRVIDRTVLLQEANEELDRFLYRSSHDLRRPLTSLLGLVQLADITVQDNAAKDIFQQVQSTALQMDRMLKKFQMVSEIYQSSAETTKPMNIEALVNEVREELKSLIEERAIEFKFLHTLPEVIDYHPFFVKVILYNIIENAVVFSKNLTPYIDVEVNLTKTSLKIVVRDNGVGIEPKYLADILNMYFRANENARGDGLGLYVTKKAADKLKGKIYIDSEIDEFTEVTIMLPYNNENKA